MLTTVDSKRHPNQVTTDYGNKALTRPTDQVKGMPWLQVGSQGAEYGTLKWTDAGRDLKLGERVEIYCTKLDMSTAVYDRYYVVVGTSRWTCGRSWDAAARRSGRNAAAR